MRIVTPRTRASFSAAMIAQSVSEYAAISTDFVADRISAISICSRFSTGA